MPPLVIVNVPPESSSRLSVFVFAFSASFQPFLLLRNHLLHERLAEFRVLLFTLEERCCDLVLVRDEFESLRHIALQRMQIGSEKGIRIVRD